MDIEEAIEILSNFDMQVTAKADGAYQSTIGEKACRYAIDGLKELEQYRQIGTVDECMGAREKQIPKDIEFYGDSDDGKMLCPNCEEDLWDIKDCGFRNCPYCGQALEWGD